MQDAPPAASKSQAGSGGGLDSEIKIDGMWHWNGCPANLDSDLGTDGTRDKIPMATPAPPNAHLNGGIGAGIGATQKNEPTDARCSARLWISNGNLEKATVLCQLRPRCLPHLWRKESKWSNDGRSAAM